jgi:hypothetical protein
LASGTVLGRAGVASVPVEQPRVYELGEVGGVGLVVATALALVAGERVLDVAPIPEVDGRVHKIEGLALREYWDDQAHLLAVVDDEPSTPSAEVELRAHLA